MMNCPNCGNKVLEGQRFCDNCGTSLAGLWQAAPASSPEPTASSDLAEAVTVVASEQSEPAPSEPAPSNLPQAPAAQAPAPQPPAQQPAPISEPAETFLASDPTAADASPLSPDTEPGEAQAQPVIGARLVVNGTNQAFPLSTGRHNLIGRADPIDGIFPDVDLTAVDPVMGVSRRHAIIHEQGGQWFIQDLNSMNYTVVNRQRVMPQQEFLLEDGDEIRFARVTVTFKTT